MFNFLKNYQIVFQNGMSFLRSLSRCVRVPVLPHSGQYLVSSVFLNFNHFNKHVIVFQCGFNLHFPNS